MFNPVKAASAVALVALTLTGCAANEPADEGTPTSTLTGTLNGAGASSAGTAQEAWIAEFQTANDGVTVN